MSFRLKVIAIVLIAIMVVGICYVGNTNNKQTEEDKEQAYYQTETVYLWYTDDTFTDFFTNAAVAFHEKYSDIRVIPVLVESQELLEKVNEASLSDEDFPDIYVTSNDSLEKAYLAGLASETRDVSNVLNSAHFSEGALNAVTYHGKYVAYPFTFETSVLLYNKTYLEEHVENLLEQEAEEAESTDTGETGDSEETGIEYDEDGNIIEDDGSGEGVTDIEVSSYEDFIPKTFETIKDFANTYQAPDGVEGVLKWDVTDIFYNYFFVGKYMIVGGDAGDDTSNIDIYNANTLSCMQEYQELNQFFAIDASDSAYEDVINDFLDGKMVYTIVTSDAIATVNEKVNENLEAIEAAEKEKKRLEEAAQDAITDGESGDELQAAADAVEIPSLTEYGFATMPDLTEDYESRSLSVTEALVINGYSTKKDAANKFAAFVSTDYASQIYTRTGKLAASTDAGYTEEAFKVFQEEYADSMPLPKLVEASNLWVQLEITFTKVWEGEDADTMLKSFSDQISSQLME